jgi:predicted nuclease of predicted toxin-antitoxin system
VRFYLDENLSPRIGAICRELGLDVVSAIETGNNGLTDLEQLRVASGDKRCLVTQNRADFVRLTVMFFEQQEHHAGVVLVPDSLPTDHFSGIAQALHAYAEAHPGQPMDYVVDFL